MTQRELRKMVEALLSTQLTSRKVYQRQPWTCVVLRVRVDGPLGEEREACGFSKVMYPDAWNAERGVELAEQKALASLAKELIRENPDSVPDIVLDSGLFVEGFLMDPISRM